MATMNDKQRAEAFKAFKEAHKDAEAKVCAITNEAIDTMSNLYDTKRKEEVKINVVDALNLDLYYEHVFHSRFSVEKMPFFIGDMEEDGTEEEFAFVSQRLNDLMETAKSNFEKIKHLVSKYD